MGDIDAIHYGPFGNRDEDHPTALCGTTRWAILTKERWIVTCRECLTLLTPRECSVCHLEHGREVEHVDA